MAGRGLYPWYFPDTLAVAGAAAAALLALIPAAARPGPRIWPLMALCLAAGYLHADLRLPEPPAESPAIVTERQKVVLSGIVGEVLTRPGQRLEIRLDRTSWRTESGGGKPPGRVAWTWDLAGARPEPGTEVRIEGVRVKTARGFVNPDIWDYEFYRRLQGVFYRVYTKGAEARVALGEAPGSAFERLRDRFRLALEHYAPAHGPGRGLPQALTMGDRNGLDERVVELFRLASLLHSLALSGMHLGFVAGLGFGFVWPIRALWPRIYLVLPRPKLAVLAAAPLLAFYIWLGGASPSLVRSGIMFASFGLMLMLGRGRVLVDGLFMALALILIDSPLLGIRHTPAILGRGRGRDSSSCSRRAGV